jgi:PAS domain S-box-containing protein
VRFGTLPVLIISLLNIVEFYGPRWSWPLGCAWFNCLLSVSCLSLTFTRWFSRNWLPVVGFLLTALIASKTVLGISGQEPMLLFVSLILLMVGTGSILPWPTRVQVSFNLVCLAAWTIQSLWVPSLDGKGPFKMAGLLTAVTVSWFTCYARDRFVREHQKSERIVRESEGALRQIFDANTDAITLIDFETRHIVDVNEQFVRLSGFRRDEVVGKTTDGLNVWADPAIEKEFGRRIQTDGSVTNMEVSYRVKDGRIVPCLVSSVIIVVHGKRCVMTLARDVTELRESQEKLRESEEKFRLIFESSRDSVMVTRASDARISDVNSQFIRLSGFTREEVIGRSPLELGMWTVPEQRLAVV